MKRRRRGIELFNMAFLDVVSCGFGAIILLLVIVKISEPLLLERIRVDLSGVLAGLQQQRQTQLRDQQRGSDELQALQPLLAEQRQRLAILQTVLDDARSAQRANRLELATQTRIEQQLQAARQRLSVEQQRLLGSGYRRSDATVGGVPVDSEYIIFIIDTSGSMQRYAWPLVRKKMAEVLDLYPTVKGIQVINDMGEYMFSQYKGHWISDTPARRRAILKRLANWAPFSNSSPVEGIEAAIRRFYAADKRISLYIFGDDFSRGSIEQVVDTVANLNRSDGSGRPRVRIHAVGFPVLLENPGNEASAVRFAALMRKLAESNGGSFVGLSGSRP